MNSIIKKLKNIMFPVQKKTFSYLQIELTNNCTCKCLLCPQSTCDNTTGDTPYFKRKKGFIEYDLYKSLIDFAIRHAALVNFSFFGEPMLHPEFLKFMDYLRDRPSTLSVVMNTNLTMATKEIFDKLIEIKLDDLRISLDSATRETYNLLRCGSRFVDLDGKPIKDNRFETITEKAEYWFSLKNHVPTRHVFAVSSKNRGEVKKFVKQWQPLLGDKDIILFKSILTYGGIIRDPLISGNPCNTWDSKGLTIDWQGNISPCNLDVNMELNLGHFPETDMLNIFSGSEYEKLKTLSNKKEITPCLNCIDANNWTKNIVLKKGEKPDKDFDAVYNSISEAQV